MDRAGQRSQRLLGLIVCAVGLAMLVSTLARGGGPLAIGVLAGAAFTALGAGRWWLAGAGGR